jgi:hypothetical protein
MLELYDNLWHTITTDKKFFHCERSSTMVSKEKYIDKEQRRENTEKMKIVEQVIVS